MTDSTFAPGSVIANRGRLWRVDAQAGDVLIATTLAGGETAQQSFYLPFEDVQPGRLPYPSAQLVGHPSSQDLLLRAYRLSLLHGSAPMLSLQRSRVIPKDYQLVPVVMALETPRVRMLIADDVGLGKTIEAGLIITELLARQMATRLLVIVPANLREQWKDALDYFFHIPARIISTQHRREMERELPAGANPWQHYRYLITSVDYAKQPAIKNQILEQAWDIVLIDEAHQVAKPHQSGPDQRVQMERYEFARTLASSARVRHLLLLTATPHNGYTDSFASLLAMLDVGAVAGPAHAPRVVRSAAERHVCQRRRQDVEAWFGDDTTRSPFPQRDQSEVVVAPSTYESEAIRAVEAYGERVLSNAQAGSIQTRTLAHWTVLHLHKRALSSPEALRCSLRNRREGLRRRLEGQITEDEEAGLSPEVARATVLDEDSGEQLDSEEAGQRTERVHYGSPEMIRAEMAELEGVLKKAEQVTPGRDSKLNKLLDSTLRDALGRDPKAILFTRYVDTMEYLKEQIAKDRRYADAKVLTIQGRLNERQRSEVFKESERAKKAVLIATDAISEGINLQRAACQVIHYELPWNPNRLEQRNGRIDRFGQPKKTVYIRTMVMDETLDATILKVLVEKARQIRADYGFSPPYFGDETDVLKLMAQHDVRLRPTQLSFEDIQTAEDSEGADAGAAENPFADETLERIRDESFYGQTHIALPEIERRLQETEATVGSPAQIQAFVRSGLERFGCRRSDNADGTWRIVVSSAALRTATVPEVIERATFDAQRGIDDPDVTVLDLGHPLVRRLIEAVKESAFEEEDGQIQRSASTGYGRSACIVTADAEEVTALFHLLARYVVETEPAAIVEELLPVAAPVYGGEPLGVEAVRRLLAARPSPRAVTDVDAREWLSDALGMESLESVLEGAVEARRRELAEERRRMKARWAEQEQTAPAKWMAGIDRLAPGSFDVLAVTVYAPA